MANEKVYFDNLRPCEGDKVQYVLTKTDENGLRVLANANQGRYHCNTREEAEAYWKSIQESNNSETVERWFPNVKILAAMCFHHGDCRGTVFGFEDEDQE